VRPLKNFDEFIKEGIVKKQSPNKPRAVSLLKESENSYKVLGEFVRKLGLNDTNANNIIKSAYDIIMELVRAKMLLNGLNSSGQGSHEAEVAYLRELRFSETEIYFANQLRYFRNGITYYGRSFDADYAKKVIEFLDKIYKRLQNV